jgi:hypothetical protein
MIKDYYSTSERKQYNHDYYEAHKQLKGRKTPKQMAKEIDLLNSQIKGVLTGKSKDIRPLQKAGYEVKFDNEAYKTIGKKYFGKHVEISNKATNRTLYSAYGSSNEDNNYISGVKKSAGLAESKSTSITNNRYSHKDISDKFDYQNYLNKPDNQGGDTINDEFKQYKEDLRYIKGHKSEEKLIKEARERANRVEYRVDSSKRKYEALHNPESIARGKEIAKQNQLGADLYSKMEKFKKQKSTSIGSEKMRSTNKQVTDKIQQHIRDYYENDEDLIHDMESASLPGDTSWKKGERLVEGGTFLIYNGDMSDKLNEWGLNPQNKKYDSQKSYNTYKSLMGRELAKIYDKVKNKKA